MAYAYQTIDQIMNGTQGAQNQNVFQDQGGQTQVNPQGQMAAGEALKTSTEGDLGSQGGGSNAGPKQVKSSEVSSDQNQRNAASSAVKANIGKTAAPKALGTVQANINDQNAALAQRAADYTAKQNQGQQYGLDTSIIDQAIAGNKDAAGNVTSLLNRQNINQVDRFDPGNYQVKDAALLKNEAGLKQLASRGMGPQYTPGMSAFDVMLMRRDPAFNQEVQKLQSQVNALDKNAKQKTEDLTKQAEEYGKKNLQDSQSAAKNYLGGQRAAIDAENVKEAAQAQAQLDALDRNKINQEAQVAAQRYAQEQLDKMYGTGRASNQLANAGVNSADFIKYATGYDPSQFYSQQDADRYNAINSLLGMGGQAKSATSAGPAYSLDQQGLNNALLNTASTARQAQDTQNLSEIERLMADANARAAEMNKQRGMVAGNYGNALDMIGQEILSNPELTSTRDPSNRFNVKSLASFANPEVMKAFNQQYQAANPLGQEFNQGLMSRDVLSQQEADQLNNLSRDLYGDQATAYNQGSAFGSKPGALVQGDMYKQALIDYLTGIRNQPTPVVDQMARASGDVRASGNNDTFMRKLERGAERFGDTISGWI